MKSFLFGFIFLSFCAAQAAPTPPAELELRRTLNLSSELGIAGNSMYNPRYFDGNVYVSQINVPAIGRYAPASTTAAMGVAAITEHRMIAPFRGANASLYIFGASGAATTTFSRYDADGLNQIEAPVPGDAQTSEGFDWVDESTII